MLTRATTRTLFLLSPRATPTTAHALLSRASLALPPHSRSRSRRLLSSASPYPLYYELISYRPPRRPPRPRTGGDGALAASQPAEGGGGEDGGTAEEEEPATATALDRSKRKYYRKRAKRLYGESDSEGDGGPRGQSEFVELEPEVVDFPRLHAREEELYFYDAFAFPWEKEKHYRMVYQLEKKYFPDQCLDKAFVEQGREPAPEVKAEGERKRGGKRSANKRDEEKKDERGLIFFEEQGGLQADNKRATAGNISEKKVEDFFKCLKKVPSAAGDGSRAVATTGEPFLASRKTGLPPKWDGPSGTVVLVDKPKGELTYLASSRFCGV